MTYKTCVSIAEKTPKKLKQTLAKALKKSDYAEIRFDFLNPNSVPDVLHLIYLEKEIIRNEKIFK
jgi:3-dehydroquinate dehydratase-1